MFLASIEGLITSALQIESMLQIRFFHRLTVQLLAFTDVQTIKLMTVPPHFPLSILQTRLRLPAIARLPRRV